MKYNFTKNHFIHSNFKHFHNIIVWNFPGYFLHTWLQQKEPLQLPSRVWINCPWCGPKKSGCIFIISNHQIIAIRLSIRKVDWKIYYYTFLCRLPSLTLNNARKVVYYIRFLWSIAGFHMKKASGHIVLMDFFSIWWLEKSWVTNWWGKYRRNATQPVSFVRLHTF